MPARPSAPRPKPAATGSSRTSTSLKAVRRANQKQPLIGLFAPGNMPVRWLGPTATYHGNLNQPAVSCEANPKRTADIPTLAQMTSKAIEPAEGQSERLLPAGRGRVHRQTGPRRESVRPDRRDRRPRRSRAEGPGLRQGRWRDPGDRHRRPRPLQPDHPAGNRRAGADPTAHDQDGAPLAISYGNSEEGSQEHTGTQLRIAAYGPQAAMSPV